MLSKNHKYQILFDKDHEHWWVYRIDGEYGLPHYWAAGTTLERAIKFLEDIESGLPTTDDRGNERNLKGDK